MYTSAVPDLLSSRRRVVPANFAPGGGQVGGGISGSNSIVSTIDQGQGVVERRTPLTRTSTSALFIVRNEKAGRWIWRPSGSSSPFQGSRGIASSTWKSLSSRGDGDFGAGAG